MTNDRRVPGGDGVPIQLVLGGGSLLNQVGRELRTVVDGMLAPYDLTAQQAALLLSAARQETSPNRLAPELGTDTAGMTRLLDRLEAKGLVRRRRHPDDRRSVVVEVTGQGRALVPRLAPVFGRASARLLAGLSEEEVRLLTALLERMLRNLRQDA
ncbi:MarR family transcriptional regulator [Microbispora cellulosiformans]|uniref:MarR family transcriptional regulator n=1 Tax=Microbispora cellulosiformans TaxID=2614688 RepID=A0A5J5K2H6_9ACTN|nr:MarR family transcriptional regulator [Microbispora cellulosiformans]KAA9377419.1 MarR family transcriptional regulator [Microbispora cellulosiformans]